MTLKENYPPKSDLWGAAGTFTLSIFSCVTLGESRDCPQFRTQTLSLLPSSPHLGAAGGRFPCVSEGPLKKSCASVCVRLHSFLSSRKSSPVWVLLCRLPIST